MSNCMSSVSRLCCRRIPASVTRQHVGVTNLSNLGSLKLPNLQTHMNLFRTFPEATIHSAAAEGLRMSGGQKQRRSRARPRTTTWRLAVTGRPAHSTHGVRPLVQDSALDHVMRGRTVLVIAHRCVYSYARCLHIAGEVRKTAS
jgi:ABC-type transport system involved in Fe-S cluster assembly fused permease/ATPase subunit